MLLNKVRAIGYMRQHKLDALILTSPVNVTYFTDYHCWLDEQVKEYFFSPGASPHRNELYAIFPLEGDPALVVNPIMAVNASDLWVRDLIIYGDTGVDFSLDPSSLSEVCRRYYDLLREPQDSATPLAALINVLERRGLTEGRIGLEKEGVPSQGIDAITEALPQALIKDCSNLIRLIRMVKSREELARLELAAAIAEHSAIETFEMARPGMDLKRLIENYRAGLAARGADFDHFSFGFRGLGIGTESSYHLSEDDVLYIDFACVYQHYFGDSGATLALKKPTDALTERYTALFESVQAAAATLGPGVKASSVCQQMWRVLKSRGVTRLFPHGHGIGLECRDYPIIVTDNGLRITDDCVDEPSDLPLESGMVINLEAGMFTAGVGSIQVEQSFRITEHSSEPLIPQDRSQPFQPVY